jgi:HK97 family phage major capsid protein
VRYRRAHSGPWRTNTYKGKQLNTAQLAARRGQIETEAAEIDRLIASAVTSKSYAGLGALEVRVDQLAADRAELDRAEASHKAAARHPLSQFGGSAASLADDEHQGVAGDNRRLAFTAKMAKGLVERKSLASSGAAVVGQEFQPDPIALGKPAVGLLDVLPTKGHSSELYAYLRQSTRTNNAAVVAEGATKPTSVYSVTRVEQSLSVIAHLSEGIPHYWLADNPTLTGFLSNELNYGLSKAVEVKVLSDINGTSGIITQAWATSIPVTLRKAMTALETTGYIASAIVLHPSDFETIELALSTTNAVEHMGLPYDPATRRLYGVPIATTIAQTAGVGHVLAQGAVTVDTDHLGIQLTWSETSNATDFAQNLTRARLEGRWGTSVYQPGGVVKATLVSS